MNGLSILLALALATAASIAGIQSSRLAKLNAAHVQCTEVNGTNQQTITDLRAANDEWAGKFAAKTADQAAAVEQLQKLQSDLAAQLTAGKAARTVIYSGDSNAKTWATQPYPDPLADRLRAPPAGAH